VGHIENLKAVPTESSVSLSWDPVPRVEGYRVLPITTPPYAKLNVTNTVEPKVTSELKMLNGNLKRKFYLKPLFNYIDFFFAQFLI
jgi:hypothetical protein